MGLSSLTTWEVRSTGNNLNGGAFVPGSGGTDRSQQDAAQVTIDNSAIVCSTPTGPTNTLTFVSGYTPTSADVGNVVNIAAGTNVTPGFYQITGTTSTTWTLSGASNFNGTASAGSAITGRMGGALATLAFGASAQQLNTVYVKSGVTLSASSGTFPSYVHFVGYGTTRGDAARATVTINAAGIKAIDGGQYAIVENLRFDQQSNSGSYAFYWFGFASSQHGFFNCDFVNFVTSPISSRGVVITNCYAKASATNVNLVDFEDGGPISMSGCYVDEFIVTLSNNSGMNVFFNNTFVIGAATKYSISNGSKQPFHVEGNTFYGKGTAAGGVWFSAGQGSVAIIPASFRSNVFSAFTGPGIVLLTDQPVACGRAENNAYYACTGTPTIRENLGAIALSADPHVNAAAGNFVLNSTAGGGAACRAAGLPGAFPGGTTTGFRDVGAVQSAASGGGGSTEKSYAFVY